MLFLPVFYCLGTSNSFVSTLSNTKENHLSSHVWSLRAIVLLICSVVFRPDRVNLHSVCGQQNGVSLGTSEGPFSFLGLSPLLFRV